jgi:hypothetical protein
MPSMVIALVEENSGEWVQSFIYIYIYICDLRDFFYLIYMLIKIKLSLYIILSTHLLIKLVWNILNNRFFQIKLKIEIKNKIKNELL